MRKTLKLIAPIAALGLAAALGGCTGWSNSGFDGVPLAELDMSGETPTGVALAGPDRIVVTEGPALDITVEADSDVAALLRFRIEDGVVGVGRDGGDWTDRMGASDIAIITVTMPALDTLEIAGSGTIDAARAVGDVSVDIAGSGTANIARIEASALGVEIAGNGTVRGAGTADNFNLDIAGSGSVEMEGLKTDRAAIEIAGSGDAIFASDGAVTASIAGSGDVTVVGSATCSSETAGSGSVTCRPVAQAAAGG